MKLTKEEFIEKYSSHFENDDEKIAFLEDISDSIEVKGDRGEEIEKLKAENEMLKQKYIDRFLSGEEAEKKAEEFEDKIDEPEEKEIIDIKEI